MPGSGIHGVHTALVSMMHVSAHASSTSACRAHPCTLNACMRRTSGALWACSSRAAGSTMRSTGPSHTSCCLGEAVGAEQGSWCHHRRLLRAVLTLIPPDTRALTLSRAAGRHTYTHLHKNQAQQGLRSATAAHGGREPGTAAGRRLKAIAARVSTVSRNSRKGAPQPQPQRPLCVAGVLHPCVRFWWPGRARIIPPALFVRVLCASSSYAARPASVMRA